jgi:uncharacterized membrane protein
MSSVLLTLSATAIGLLAGVMSTFCFVIMPGLARGTDQEFVRAMQHFNRSIQNLWFMYALLGSLLFPVLALFLADSRILTGIALACAAVAIGITAAGNIPMNNALDRASSDTPEEAHAAREAFERPWNRLNVIRTVISTGGFFVAVAACLAA